MTSAIPLVTKGRPQGESPPNVNMNYFLGIDATTGVLVADFEDTVNGGNHPVSGTAAVTSGVWHHAAATYDTVSDTWRLYLDGVLDRTLVLAGDFTPESTSIQHAALGTAMTARARPAASSTACSTRPASGTSPGPPGQVAAGRDLELASGSGLIGRWGFGEAAGTTITNSVAGGVNGTAVGGPLWVGGAPVAPPPANGAPVFSTDLADQTDAEGDVVASTPMRPIPTPTRSPTAPPACPPACRSTPARASSAARCPVRAPVCMR